MSTKQRMRLGGGGEASTPGSARKRGRPSGAGKTTPGSMGPKRAGKRVSGVERTFPHTIKPELNWKEYMLICFLEQ